MISYENLVRKTVHAEQWCVYLGMPAARFGDVSRRLFFVIRRQERCDLDITEQVAQPRSNRQVVNDLRSSLLSIPPSEPPIRTTDRTARTVGVLIVCQFWVFAVDEGHVVVRAGLELDHTTLADLLQEAFGQGPRSRVGVVREQEQQEIVDRLCARIGGFMDAHPFEVHQQQLAECNIRVYTLLGVHFVLPPFGPCLEISTLVVEGCCWRRSHLGL